MAAPGGNNQVARRVIDDLIEFNGETSVDGYMSFFKFQQIAETRSFINRMRDEVNTARNLFGQLTALIAELEAEQNQRELFDTLMDLRDDRENARIKLQGLNKLVNDAEAEVEEKEAQVMGMIYVCVKNELCMDVLLFDPYLPVILFVNGDLIFLFRLLPAKSCYLYTVYMGHFFILERLSQFAGSPHLVYKMRYVFGRSQAEDQAFSGLISNICIALRISLSKKRKLIAKLEVVEDEEGAAKGLENLTVVVARDTATLGDLEHLLTRSQVGVTLKACFVNDMQPMQ
ncbi:hypothetical protein Tco_1313306 [Tanacetum coccineum]